MVAVVLDGVTCVTASDCRAVGEYDDASSHLNTLIEQAGACPAGSVLVTPGPGRREPFSPLRLPGPVLCEDDPRRRVMGTRRRESADFGGPRVVLPPRGAARPASPAGCEH